MREGLSFEKESPSCALPKKAGAGLIYRLQIKLYASEAIPKRPIGLFSFAINKSPSRQGTLPIGRISLIFHCFTGAQND